MTFLNSIFLWGALAASVPILIHLFSRKRKVVIPWGAMQFLMEKPPRKRAKFLKLNELILLLLRILAVILLSLAFARPLVSFFGGGQVKRDLIFILDASLSTSVLGTDGKPLFDQQKELAIETIESLNENDYLRVLVSANSQQWINDTPVAMDKEQRNSLIAKITSLQPTSGATDFPLAIQEALALPPAEVDLPKQITIFADGSANGWHADDSTVWTSAARFISEAPNPTHVEFLLAGNNPTKGENILVEKIDMERETATRGALMTARATFRNASTYTSSPRTADWKLNGKTIGATTIPALLPDQATTLSLQFTAPDSGVHDLSCNLGESDTLPRDNTNHSIFEVIDEIPVLVIDGNFEEETESFHESGFFLSAIGYHPDSKKKADTRSIFRPKIISPDSLNQENLTNYFCVVLANARALTPAEATHLEDYVRAGGGLWIALGDQTDPAEAEKTMSRLCPVSLIGASEELTGENTLGVRPPLEDDSPIALLGDLERLDTDRIRATRFHRIGTPLPSGISVPLSFEGGAPLLMEHTLGSGKITISTIPLNLRWSNLPLTHSYVVLIHELLWHMLEPQLTSRNLTPGAPFSWRPLPGLVGEPATMKKPDGKTTGIKSISDQVLLGDTTDPGLYTITSPAMEKESLVQYFHVSGDPAESDTRLLSEQEKSVLTDTGGLTYTDSPLASAPESYSNIRPKNPFWSVLLLLLLGLFLIEAFLAHRLLRYRRMKRTPAAMTPQIR
ncbi:BatA domain-containing protein [Luteolibacter sp. AS25]|uniref:BatA domain-containing protein n=1 Tax=Luteolibacter sp. AS25 TaxID=3135776 RepID=UPI00398B1DC1